MNYTQTFLMTNMNAFPATRIPMIQQELENLDDQGMNVLLMADIKNPTVALLLSIFAGSLGIDRFYIGNKELGIAKLALMIFGFITSFIFIGIFFLFAAFIWQVVDIFLIMGACKEANFERFTQAINQVNMMQRTADSTTATTEVTPVASTVISEVVAEEAEVVTEVETVSEETVEASESIPEEVVEVISESTEEAEEVVVEAVETEGESTEESISEEVTEVVSESAGE
ncbi:TPA: TM2 domain-containing protein [Streptococcus suis]